MVVTRVVEAEQVFPELPDELKLHVLSFLAERDMAVFGAVCRQAAAMANDNHLWKRLYSRRYDSVQPPAAPVPFPSSAPPSPSVPSRSAPPSPAPRSLYASASPALAARFARSAPASPYAAADADVAVAVAAPSPGLTRRPHRLLPALAGSPQVNAARPARQAEAPRNDNRGRKDDDALEAALGKLSLEAEAVVDAQAAGAEAEAHEELNSCEWKEHMQYRHMVLHKRWRQEAPYAVTTARGHTGNVYCIQFDSENDLLISSSQDATVKLWDMSATTATLNCTLKGHTGPVGSVSFLPSAHLAISGSDDKTIRVWDTARAAEAAAASKDGGGSSSASCVKVLQTGGEDGVWALQFDAQRLVADSGDKTMGMWDTETMELLTKFSGHTKFVECLQYDGNLLFSGAQDHDLIMWDMSTAQPLHHFKACKASVYCLQADDTKLICGSADKSIYCWDLRTRKLLWQSSVNRGWIGGVMFDCSKVISCSSDKTVRVLDVETGKATSKWQQHTKECLAGLPHLIRRLWTSTRRRQWEVNLLPIRPRWKQIKRRRRQRRQRFHPLPRLKPNLQLPGATWVR